MNWELIIGINLKWWLWLGTQGLYESRKREAAIKTALGRKPKGMWNAGHWMFPNSTKSQWGRIQTAEKRGKNIHYNITRGRKVGKKRAARKDRKEWEIARESPVGSCSWQEKRTRNEDVEENSELTMRFLTSTSGKWYQSQPLLDYTNHMITIWSFP